MKSLFIQMRVLWTMLLLSIVSVSCTNDMDLQENNNSNKSTILTEAELEIRENIASLHSQGLDYVYSKLNEDKPNSRAEIIDNSSLQINISNLTEEFIKTSPVQKTISNYSVLFVPRTRVAYQEQDNQERINRISNYFDNFVNQCNDEDILGSIEQYISSDTIKVLNEDDRSVLLLALFIYEDSYNYWSNIENFEKWAKFKPEVQTRALSWSSIWSTVKKYANIDGNGGIAGGVGGAAGGAVGGAMAGGVGALPGAAAGFVTGAISGAVTESIMAAIS